MIQPSDDPTAIARRHLRAMPRSLRTLLRTIGALDFRHYTEVEGRFVDLLPVKDDGAGGPAPTVH